MALPRNLKIPTKDFKKLAKGAKYSFGWFGLKVMGNRGNGLRFAVVVPARVLKKAVARNKIRRQIQAVLAQAASKSQRNLDVAITIRQAPPAEFKNIKNAVRSALLKTGAT